MKNTFKFSNNDINKFSLLLRKGVYPTEYMDNWENFHEITLPEKEDFCANLSMKGMQIIYIQKEFVKTLK